MGTNDAQPGTSSLCERKREDRYEFRADVVCENADGEAVLEATVEGQIWKDGDA